MTEPIKWFLNHDPWIDNGLELFGRLVERIQQQHPQVVQVRWQPEALEITIHDDERFLDVLDDAIQQQIQRVVFYTAERQGQKRLIMKPFVGFNQQGSKQHPPIFQQDKDKRQQFLRGVFGASTPQRRGKLKGCPLCGEGIAGGEEELTLSVYPFVTKIRSLSGIRTQWREEGLSGFAEYLPVCPRCYFLGSLVWADDALLYLCDIGGTDGNAVILLPAPLASSLLRLREVKAPKYGERRTNVRFKRRPKRAQQENREEQEDREVQDGTYSLLLAFLERTMEEIAERNAVTDLFTEVRRRVSEGWLILSIPQGRLKNITAHNLILDEPVLRLLARLVEQGDLPYAHCISEMGVTDEKGGHLQDVVPALHEQLAKAILTDDFDLFALVFIPKPRRLLHFPFEIEGVTEKLVALWRWSDMDAQTLEIVKKAGRALARIAASRKQPVLLYALERVRSASDLLEVLKEGIHRLIGLEAEEMRYISLDALEQLTELVHQVTDARQFADLKNTLIIFAGIDYAKHTMVESQQALAGGEA